MAEIIIDGKTVEFEEFTPNMKNSRKINLLDKEGDSEGIWAAFNDEDAKKYDEDVSSGIAIVVLLNHALAGPPWGTYLPVRFRGTSRPECRISELSGDVTLFTGNPINEEESPE